MQQYKHILCLATLAVCGLASPLSAAANNEAGGKPYTYYVLDFTQFVTCPLENVPIYKQPSTSSPHRIYADVGEGTYTLWSDEEREEDIEYYDYTLSSWTAPLLGKSGGFYIMPENDVEGYVKASDTEIHNIEKLTLQELDKEEDYFVIKEGPYKDWIIFTCLGEGGATFYLGRLENNVVTFPFSFYPYYDDDTEGINYDAESSTISFGPMFRYDLYDYMPVIDFKKMTPAAFEILFKASFLGSEDNYPGDVTGMLYKAEGLEVTFISKDIVKRHGHEVNVILPTL